MAHSLAQHPKLKVALAVLVFLLGAALIAYPYVSDALHKRAQAQVTSAQTSTVEKTDTTKLDAERQKAIDYNNRLLASRTVVTDPFDPNTQEVTNKEYKSLLNLAGDGVMGTINIPKIGLSIPIYHGTDDEELQKGVGHLEGSSLPVGGASTHTVLAGHNGLPSVKIFDNIGKLEAGDYLVLQVLGEDLAYRVTDTETVLPEETDSLVIEEGKDLVTLVTCVPYGINTHRLLVHAERCDVPKEWLNRDKEPIAPEASSVADTPLLPLTLVGVAIGLGLVAARALAKRKAGKKAGAASSAAGIAAAKDAVAGNAYGTSAYVARARNPRADGPRGIQPMPAINPGGRAGDHLASKRSVQGAAHPLADLGKRGSTPSRAGRGAVERASSASSSRGGVHFSYKKGESASKGATTKRKGGAHFGRR